MARDCRRTRRAKRSTHGAAEADRGAASFEREDQRPGQGPGGRTQASLGREPCAPGCGKSPAGQARGRSPRRVERVPQGQPGLRRRGCERRSTGPALGHGEARSAGIARHAPRAGRGCEAGHYAHQASLADVSPPRRDAGPLSPLRHPEEDGGIRNISAPKRALGLAQRWVFENVLGRLHPSPRRTVRRRSVHRQQCHPACGPSVRHQPRPAGFLSEHHVPPREGLVPGLGYSEHVATVLALLCTEPPRVPARLDGKLYFVALGQRVLPQGACTSPAITNALCRRLDRRLRGLAARHAFTYTRYADDLTFSGRTTRCRSSAQERPRDSHGEGFAEHTDKTRVMRSSRRQEVTGVVVNTRPKISREQTRELRAILHNAARHGLASQNRDGRSDFAAYLRGRVEFACMVDPASATKWRDALTRALSNQRAP